MIVSNTKKIMEEKKVTIRQMVRDIGVSNTTIQRARCSEITLCRLYTLEAIAGYLGCKVKDLFDES